jgi:hypothetical protein
MEARGQHIRGRNYHPLFPNVTAILTLLHCSTAFKKRRRECCLETVISERICATSLQTGSARQYRPLSSGMAAYGGP